MVFIVTVVFVVCWTPYHVMSFVAVHHHHRLASLTAQITANSRQYQLYIKAGSMSVFYLGIGIGIIDPGQWYIIE